MTTAVLIAGGVASTAALAVAALKKSGVKNAADNYSTAPQAGDNRGG